MLFFFFHAWWMNFFLNDNARLLQQEDIIILFVAEVWLPNIRKCRRRPMLNFNNNFFFISITIIFALGILPIGCAELTVLALRINIIIYKYIYTRKYIE